jgi:hypothetical protein
MWVLLWIGVAIVVLGAGFAACLWVPNCSSTAVTCGIDDQRRSGMIVGRGGTTTVFDLPAGHVLSGTAGPRCTFEGAVANSGR